MRQIYTRMKNLEAAEPEPLLSNFMNGVKRLLPGHPNGTDVGALPTAQQATRPLRPRQRDEVRIVVNRTTCAGIGICDSIDPERFEVQADGKTHVLKGEAVARCPTQSLRIVDSRGRGVGVCAEVGYEMTGRTPPVITVDELIERIKIGPGGRDGNIRVEVIGEQHTTRRPAAPPGNQGDFSAVQHARSRPHRCSSSSPSDLDQLLPRMRER
jgi:ferredoxin